MMLRCLLILVGLVVVGLVGAFMLYVSPISMITAMAVILGLIATLFIGYWAGSNSVEQSSPRPELPLMNKEYAASDR